MDHQIVASTIFMTDGLNETGMSQSTLKSNHNNAGSHIPLKTACLIGPCAEQEDLRRALAILQIEVVTSVDGQEYLKRDDVAFVVDEFTGCTFHVLWTNNKRIFGPTAIKEYANARQPLPHKKRPLYCRSMEQIVVFISLTSTRTLMELVDMVHFMGGSVRKTYTMNVTHVVSKTTQSEGYRLAVAEKKAVMSVDWVRKAWERRRTVQAYAFSEEMKMYKLPAFYCLRLAFYGFTEDLVTMQQHAIDLGAEITEPRDCTHYVINTQAVTDESTIPERPNESCHLVSDVWFWTSAHMEYCSNEIEYPVKKKMATGSSSPTLGDMIKASGQHRTSQGRPSSQSKNNGSFHDVSFSLPDNMFSMDDLESMIASPPRQADHSKLQLKSSKRYLTCVELLHTEINYIQFLSTISTLFKEPLEQQVDAYGRRLLDAADVKMIFGNISDILAVHIKIREKLDNAVRNWDEKICIGRIWLDHKEDLKKCYPPFVNFFENAKEKLELCEKTNPRFQAFLKARESNPECARHRLKELLIRPVQRLPSVNLLLNDILKRTDKSHDDNRLLQDAIHGLEEVLTYVNENKRKAEGQLQMFSMMNVVQNCPAQIMSAQREFVAEVDLIDLDGVFSKKNSNITFYIFNDCVEVAKVKNGNSKERSNRKLTVPKSKKHKALVHMHKFRRFVNVTDCIEIPNLFCLTIRNEYNDDTYAFLFRSIVGRNDCATGSTKCLSPAESKAEFLNLLSEYAKRASGRDMYCENYTSVMASSVIEVVQNAMKRLKGGTLTRTLSLRSARNSAASLTRHVSQALLSGTLRRMTSTSRARPSMRGIVEELIHPSENRRLSFLTNGESSNNTSIISKDPAEIANIDKES